MIARGAGRGDRAGDRQRGSGRAQRTSPRPSHAGADAVLAASVFHFGGLSVAGVKDALAAAGYPVRQPPATLPEDRTEQTGGNADG